MTTPEFKEWVPIARLNREIIITEKIDGTNGVVYVGEDGTVLAGSRSCWLTAATGDNHGFAKWVSEHEDELRELGPGYHYGEWYGSGVNLPIEVEGRADGADAAEAPGAAESSEGRNAETRGVLMGAGRLRVYVAGPISKGDVAANVKAGIDAGLRLLTAGFAPMIPHLSALVEPDALVGTPRYEDWMETDLAWITVADALVRIPGESAGADREVAHARKHYVPVYYGVSALLGAAAASGAGVNPGHRQPHGATR